MADTSSMSIATTPFPAETVNAEVCVGGVCEVSTPDTILVGPLALEMGYKGDDITRKVGNVLGLTDLKSWSVTDVMPEAELAIAHYNEHPDVDMAVYGGVRGEIVDLKRDVKIASSFGWTPIAVADKLTAANAEYDIVDISGNHHRFPEAETVIKRAFDGVVLRVLWREGKLLIVTHRRLNAQRSRWGTSKPFVEMYREAGGPSAEQLFDVTKPYSSTYYTFLVVHPDLVVGTRQQVRQPYVVFIAQNDFDTKIEAELVAAGRKSFETVQTISGAVKQSVIHEPLPLSLEEANRHLEFGYYKAPATALTDKRQGTGEALIVYRLVNGVVADVVKVHSHAYDWRVTMRGNDPNIPHRFYSLMGIAYPEIKTEADFNRLHAKLMPFPLYEEKSVHDLFARGLTIMPEGEVAIADYAHRDARIQLLWMNYVLSLPLHVQPQYASLFSQFTTDRSAVIAWIQDIEAKNREVESLDIPNRAKSLISTARALSRSNMSKGDNFGQRGAKLSLPVLIRNSLRNFLSKEDGASLYGLIRDMKRAQAQAVEAPEVSPEVTPE